MVKVPGFLLLMHLLCGLTSAPLSPFQPRSLFRRFRLKLVTSSHACERGVAEVPRTPDQIFDDSDAMAVSPDMAHVRSSAPLLPVLLDPLAANASGCMCPKNRSQSERHLPGCTTYSVFPGDQQDEEAVGSAIPPPLDALSAQQQASAGEPEPELELREQPASPEEAEITAALAALSSLNHVQASNEAALQAPADAVPAAAAAPAVAMAARDKLAKGVTAAVQKEQKLKKSGLQRSEQQLSGAHLVASKLAAAAAAASAAAAAAAAPLASSVSSLASAGSASIASQLQSAASSGTSTAVATFATVSAGAAPPLPHHGCALIPWIHHPMKVPTGYKILQTSRTVS